MNRLPFLQVAWLGRSGRSSRQTFSEAVEDMKKFIGQKHAGPFPNFGRNAVDRLGDRARDASERIRIAAETDGRPHCAFPVRRRDSGGECPLPDTSKPPRLKLQLRGSRDFRRDFGDRSARAERSRGVAKSTNERTFGATSRLSG